MLKINDKADRTWERAQDGQGGDGDVKGSVWKSGKGKKKASGGIAVCVVRTGVPHRRRKLYGAAQGSSAIPAGIDKWHGRAASGASDMRRCIYIYI